MSRFDTQVEMWWTYIDHILMYYLRSPLPSLSVTFENDSKADETLIVNRINIFSPVDHVDDANVDALMTFMIPKYDLVRTQRILKDVFPIPGHQTVAYGHSKEFTYACKNIHPVLDDAADYYMTQITDTFRELYPTAQWIRISQYEDHDSGIGKLVEKVRNPSSTIGLLSGIFGNYDLYFKRSMTAKEELFSIYDTLGLTSQLTRADLYFKGVDYVKKKREREIDNPLSMSIFKEFNQIYEFLLELLKTYVKICRPYIHDRIHRVILKKNMEHIGYGEVYPVFDTSAKSTQRLWYTSDKEHKSDNIEDNLKEACEIMRDTIDAPNGCRLKLYYPWSMQLIRFNDGGGTNECHN